MIRPTTSEESARPRISGIVIRPETVGVLPRAIWKYWLRKMGAPNRGEPTKRLGPGRGATGAGGDNGRGAHRAGAEQLRRDDRLDGAQFDEHGQPQKREAAENHAGGVAGQPVEL